MKICIVSSGYPPEDCGGIGVYTQTLAQGLADHGETVVVVSESGVDTSYTYEAGIHIYRVHLRRYIPVIERLFPGLTWSIYLCIKLWRLDREHHFDAVEFPNWQAPGLISQILIRRLRSVIRVHTPYFETLQIDRPERPTYQDRQICNMERHSCLRANGLVSSTKNHAKLIADEYGLDMSAFTIIPLGVSDRYSTKELSEKLGAIEPIFRILYVSRLENRKGTILLIDALPSILNNKPDIHVDIVGRDRQHAPNNVFFREYFLDNYSEFSHQVHFHGFVEDEQLANLYKKADLFIVPSLYESFGIIYVEAMMFGVPSIATNQGGIPEVITDGVSGFLIKNNNSKEISECFGRVYNDRNLLKSMSLKSRELYERSFTTESMVSRSIRLYRDLTK